jgi:tetratricopeptide (TPR) repeat protein
MILDISRPRPLLLCSVLLALVSSKSSFAFDPNGNANERPLLPEYCAYTHPTGLFIKGTGTLSEGGKKWIAIHGDGNQKHIHHYCWAMVRLMRSHSAQATAQARKHLRETALADIDYSIEFSTLDFPLLAELLVRRGTTLTLLNRRPEAISSFKEAIKVNPKYAPAFYELAHMQWREGDRAGAQATIDLGLRDSPDSEMLKKLRIETSSKATGK